MYSVSINKSQSFVLFMEIGPIEKIFNNSFLVPLGRLSYSVYLVNITVVMVMEGGQRNAQFITRPSSVSRCTSILLLDLFFR